MDKPEVSEVINPKRTLNRRMEQAEHGTPTPTAAMEAAEPNHQGTKPFTKAWSQEERLEHARGLAAALRNRQ